MWLFNAADSNAMLGSTSGDKIMVVNAVLIKLGRRHKI
jgi:hypothetical protein